MADKVKQMKNSISTAIFTASGDTVKILITKLTADKDKPPKREYLQQLDMLLKETRCYQQVGKALKKKLKDDSWRVFYKSLYVMHVMSQIHADFLTYLSTSTWTLECDFNDRGGSIHQVEYTNFVRCYYNYLSRSFQVAAKMAPMKNVANFRNIHNKDTTEELFNTVFETEEKLLQILNLKSTNPLFMTCHCYLVMDISMLFVAHSFLAEVLTEYFPQISSKSVQSLYAIAQKFHKLQVKLVELLSSRNSDMIDSNLKKPKWYDFKGFIDQLRMTNAGKTLPEVNLEILSSALKGQSSTRSAESVQSQSNRNPQMDKDPFQVSGRFSPKSNKNLSGAQNDPFSVNNNAPMAVHNDPFSSNAQMSFLQPSGQGDPFAARPLGSAPSAPLSPYSNSSAPMYQTSHQPTHASNSGIDLFNQPSYTDYQMSSQPMTSNQAAFQMQPFGGATAYGNTQFSAQPNAFSGVAPSTNFSNPNMTTPGFGLNLSSPNYAANLPSGSLAALKERSTRNEDMFTVAEEPVEAVIKNAFSNMATMTFPTEFSQSNTANPSSGVNYSNSQAFSTFGSLSSFGDLSGSSNDIFGSAPSNQTGVNAGAAHSSVPQPKPTTNPFDDDF